MLHICNLQMLCCILAPSLHKLMNILDLFSRLLSYKAKTKHEKEEGEKSKREKSRTYVKNQPAKRLTAFAGRHTYIRGNSNRDLKCL